jgi:cyclopropane-fatty-acyl-phospholipid synthase
MSPLRVQDRTTLPATTLLGLLDRHLDGGRLRFRLGAHAGAVERVVGRSGPEAGTIVVRDEGLFARVLAFGNLGLGEAYMDEQFQVPEGRLPEVLMLLARSRLDRVLARSPTLVATALWLRFSHARRGRQANVRSHYDLGNDLFAMQLDSTLAYSAGYATSEDDDSETLQQRKLDRLCDKLRLAPGDRFLDLGCGFGGLVLHAARTRGVRAVGYTIAVEHAEEARRRAAAAGLADRVEIRLERAEALTGTYDKIASIGMLEHFHPWEYPGLVARIGRTLAPDGLALFDFMASGHVTNTPDPFTQKYLFPGSNQPTLGQIARACERAELAILDVENVVRHFGVTGRRWLEQFQRGRSALDPARYDARFQRMWEYYLSLGVAAASASDAAVYQVLVQNGYAARRPLQRV